MAGPEFGNFLVAEIECSPEHPEGETELARFLTQAGSQSNSSVCVYTKVALPGQLPRRSLLIVDPISHVAAYYDLGGRLAAPRDVADSFAQNLPGFYKLLDVTKKLRHEAFHEHAGDIGAIDTKPLQGAAAIVFMQDQLAKFAHAQTQDKSLEWATDLAESNSGSVFKGFGLFDKSPGGQIGTPAQTHKPQGPGFNRNSDG